MLRLKRLAGGALTTLGLLFITINPLAQPDNANVAAGLAFFSAGLVLLHKRRKRGVKDDPEARDVSD